MIDAIAGRMAEGIKRRAPDHPASIGVLKHALAVLINTVAILVISVAIGLITGRLIEVAIVLVSFAVLRMVSGGLHLKSGTWCVVVTTTGVTLLSLMHVEKGWVMLITLLSMALASIFAPSDIHRQSRIPRKYYPLLKIISVLLISINLVIGSETIAVSFLAQTILLIPRKEVKLR